jgi:hypothetical protein
MGSLRARLRLVQWSAVQRNTVEAAGTGFRDLSKAAVKIIFWALKPLQFQLPRFQRVIAEIAENGFRD